MRYLIMNLMKNLEYTVNNFFKLKLRYCITRKIYKNRKTLKKDRDYSMNSIVPWIYLIK